jgi:hypothetical protein
VERGKVIGTVNILDLRKATEESVREYESIGSANLVLYTSETAHLLHKLAIGSINTAAEVPAAVHVELIMGPLDIEADYFANLQEPIGFLLMGPLMIGPNVKPEELDRGLAVAMIMGPVTVPEPLAGILQSKAQLVMGPINPYPLLEKMYRGRLTLDRACLDALDPATELCVVGSVVAPEGIPEGLIRKKLAKLHVTGRTTCYEPSEAELRAALTGTSGNVRVIPPGFKVIDKEIRLSRDLLTSISDRKLYFTQSVVIEGDVDAGLFSKKIEGLACEQTILCPQTLQTALAEVCDLLDTNALFYEEELWLIDGKTELHPERFEYLEGKATLVVTGVLNVSPDVAPALLAARLAKVHLLGVIECSPEQQAAMESRIGTSEGVFERSDSEEKERTDGGMRSANYLAL